MGESVAFCQASECFNVGKYIQDRGPLGPLPVGHVFGVLGNKEAGTRGTAYNKWERCFIERYQATDFAARAFAGEPQVLADTAGCGCVIRPLTMLP